jgi:alkylation response protein AidB-like acyl-CoA dehydrogenase
MGLAAVPFAEVDGGMGGGSSEMAIVAEQLGRNLVATPYLESVVMAGALIDACEDTQLRGELLEQLVSGAIFTLAHFEPQSRYDDTRIATRATKQAAGYVLDGVKASVVWGNCADKLLVSAMLDGTMVVFVVEPQAGGVEIKSYPTNDNRGGADISLNAVQVPDEALITGKADGAAAIRRSLGRGRIFLACEAAALMRRMAEITRDYVAARQQFGVSIGSFQVLQHRLVDMFIEAEQSLSIALAAADTWDAPADEMARASSAARALGARAGRFVGQNAIQLHGGIGMAHETPVSHYFRRLTMNGMQLGDGAFHLRRYAEIVGQAEAERNREPVPA